MLIFMFRKGQNDIEGTVVEEQEMWANRNKLLKERAEEGRSKLLKILQENSGPYHLYIYYDVVELKIGKGRDQAQSF